MALTDNLIAFYELEEASGNATDATGNGHTLTDNNTVTSNTGKVGDCRQFTKANTEYLSSAHADFDNSNATDFTVAAWVYLDTFSSEILAIASKGWFPGWRLCARTDFATFEMLVSDSGTFVTPRTVLPTTGTWYYVVGFWDSVNDLAGISVDGASYVTASFSNLEDSATDFRVGEGPGTGIMNGRIDQLGYWTRVLTITEVGELYNSGAGLSYAEMVGGGGVSIPVVHHHRMRNF